MTGEPSFGADGARKDVKPQKKPWTDRRDEGILTLDALRRDVP